MPGTEIISKRARKNFGKIHKVIEIPNLIEVQKVPMSVFYKKMSKPKSVKT